VARHHGLDRGFVTPRSIHVDYVAVTVADARVLPLNAITEISVAGIRLLTQKSDCEHALGGPLQITGGGDMGLFKARNPGLRVRLGRPDGASRSVTNTADACRV
jgi:hypothetical protein